MDQVLCRGPDGVSDFFLLDVHMEGVEHHLNRRIVHPFAHLEGLFRYVNHIRFESIERFDSNYRTLPLRILTYLFKRFSRTTAFCVSFLP